MTHNPHNLLLHTKLVFEAFWDLTLNFLILPSLNLLSIEPTILYQKDLEQNDDMKFGATRKFVTRVVLLTEQTGVAAVIISDTR